MKNKYLWLLTLWLLLAAMELDHDLNKQTTLWTDILFDQVGLFVTLQCGLLLIWRCQVYRKTQRKLGKHKPLR